MNGASLVGCCVFVFSMILGCGASNDLSGPDAAFEPDGETETGFADEGLTGDLEGGTDRTGSTSDCGFDDKTTWKEYGEIWQLQSSDKADCVWLKRRNESLPGVFYKAVPFSLLEMRIGHAGQRVTIQDSAALTWTSTHHNWTDTGEGRASGVLYQLQVKYDGFRDTYGFVLTAFPIAGGPPVWGPIALTSFVP